MNKTQKFLSLVLLTVSAHVFAADQSQQIVPASAALVSVASQEVVTAGQMLELAKQKRISEEEEKQRKAKETAHLNELNRQLGLSPAARVMENYVTAPAVRVANTVVVGVSKAGAIVVEGVKPPLVATGAAAIGVSLWNASHSFYEDQIRESGRILAAAAAIGLTYSFFSTTNALTATAQAEQDTRDFEAAKKERYILAQVAANTATTHGALVAIEEKLAAQNREVAEQTLMLGNIKTDIVSSKQIATGLLQEVSRLTANSESARKELKKLVDAGDLAVLRDILSETKNFAIDQARLIEDFYKIKQLPDGEEKEDKAKAFLVHYETVMTYAAGMDKVVGGCFDEFPSLGNEVSTIKQLAESTEDSKLLLASLDLEKEIRPFAAKAKQRLLILKAEREARLALEAGVRAAAADDAQVTNSPASSTKLPLHSNFTVANWFGNNTPRSRPGSPTGVRLTSSAQKAESSNASPTGGNVSGDEDDIDE